ncbi:hypothetical protein V8E55_004061 [Tylopilus felleus]
MQLCDGQGQLRWWGQVISLHLSCGLDKQPKWVIFNEFVLTMRPYIRMVVEVKPEWLLELAPLHFDLSSFSDGEAKRSLQPRRQASSDGSEMVRNLPRKSRKEELINEVPRTSTGSVVLCHYVFSPDLDGSWGIY